MTRVGLIDYGMGNLQSVRNAFESLGAEVSIVKTAGDLEKATHVVLPGVGSFAEGMRHLNKQGLVEAIRAVKGRKPFLGICLGMQLMADRGTEGGDTAGLGLVGGSVPRLKETGLRIPHIGWNDVHITSPSALMGEATGVDYYFVHSYHFETKDRIDVLATCDYGGPFVCAVGRDGERIYGVQFHPEKSHRLGLEILKNFLGLSCSKNA